MSDKKIRKLALNIVYALGLPDEEHEEALLAQLEALGNNKQCDEAESDEFGDLITLIETGEGSKGAGSKVLAAHTFYTAKILYKRTSQFVATARTAILACVAARTKDPTFFMTKQFRAWGAEEAKLYVEAKAELARRRSAAQKGSSPQPPAGAVKAAAKATAKAKAAAKAKPAAKKKKEEEEEETSSEEESGSTSSTSSSSSGSSSSSSSASSSGSSSSSK